MAKSGFLMPLVLISVFVSTMNCRSLFSPNHNDDQLITGEEINGQTRVRRDESDTETASVSPGNYSVNEHIEDTKKALRKDRVSNLSALCINHIIYKNELFGCNNTTDILVGWTSVDNRPDVVNITVWTDFRFNTSEPPKSS